MLLLGHSSQWYLIEELIANDLLMMLFKCHPNEDRRHVNRNTKRKMDNALSKQGSDEPPKRLKMKPSAMLFFHTLALKANFSAHEDSARWQTLEDFQLTRNTSTVACGK